MDLKAEILKEHSRKQALHIAHWVGNREERFSQLLDIFLHGEYRVVQRSAYPLSLVTDRHPALAEKKLHLLINRLDDTGTHVAVRRNIVRILQFVNIPQEFHAKILERCMEYLSNTKEAIAVRCFSMTVLGKLAAEHPEIIPEVEWAIKKALERPSAGMRARAKKVIKQFITPQKPTRRFEW
jgi:hypothetical protein